MKTIRILALALLVLCLALVFASCGGGSGGGADGTYYRYENGETLSGDWIKLDGKNWSADDETSGRYEQKGNVLTFYSTIFGEEEEVWTATLKDGKMTVEFMGGTFVYYKKGMAPTSGGSSSTDKGNTPAPTSSVTYQITYDANGGAFADGKTMLTVTEQENAPLTAPDSPARDNYTFGGWAKQKKGSDLVDFSTDKATGNITLYATWKEKSASVLSVDGATIDGNSIFLFVDRNTESVSLSGKVVCSSDSIWKLYYDKLGQIEIPTKIAAGMDGELDDGDNVFYVVVTSNDGTQVNVYDLTVHRSYQVPVRYYDGSNFLKTESVYTGTTYSTSYRPEITGYTFNRWKTKTGAAAESAFTIWDEQSFYADKTAKTYTVTLDVNGGDPLSQTTKTVSYGAAYSLGKPTRTGYSFTGWTVGGTSLTDANGTGLAEWTYDGNRTLRAAWEINIYQVALKRSIDEAGSVTGAGSYAYGQSVTVSASTHRGYTWLGWYDGEKKLTDQRSYTFDISTENVTYTAKWFLAPAVVSSNTSAGSVSGMPSTTTNGETVTVAAQANLGYMFLGWYSGDEKLTEENTYSFVLAESSPSLVAKYELLAEMSDFIFTSTPTTCTVTGVRDQTVASLVVPDLVTSIGAGAFSGCTGLTAVTIPDSVTSIGGAAFYNCSGLKTLVIGNGVTSLSSGLLQGCSSLESLTIPFVGGSRKTANDTYQYPFGHIFGTSSYTGGTATTQYYYGSSTRSATNTTYYIPSSLKSVTVTGGNILFGAFYNCSGLTSVTIGDGVTSIRAEAFYGCSGLTSITIPDSVTSIGNKAFYNCSGLTSITIPDSVKSIGDYAFSGCSSLESITIPFVGGSRKTARDTYQYPFGYIFGTSSYTGGTEATQYYYGSSTSSTAYATYYIPSSLKSVTVTGGEILRGAFQNCSGLTSIVIPDTVTSIGGSAFYGCSGLTSITIPDSVTSIGDGAFTGCSGLTSVTIPDGVTSIGGAAFSGCSGLTSITVADGNTVYHSTNNCLIETTSKTLISGCSTSVIPTDGSVTSIGSAAFYNCSWLTSITIPDSVKSIGDYAFKNCTGLTSITIPDGVTSIGNEAFSGCSGLTSITIPHGVTSIGNKAFYGCSGLTSITIPDGVTSIGNEAFSGCSGLKSVTIPDSVTSIGGGALFRCSSLASITIPFVGGSRKTASDTDQYPFGYIFGTGFYTGGTEATQYYYGSSTSSTTYTTYYIPSSLKSVTVTGGEILYGAFYDCSGLTSVTIGDGVTSIGHATFKYCSGLTSVTIGNGVTSIGDHAFYGCSRLTSITIGDGVISIGNYAFYNCSGLTSVTIPDSVTSIGAGAFSGCSSLESLTIPFVGESRKTASDTDQYPFGYIFGTGFNSGGTETKQYYYGSSTSSTTYTTYYIPSSLKSVTVTGGEILYGAFYDCSGLTSVTIGDGFTSIGDRAFYNCSGLTSITIPDGVTSIGDSAFNGCSGLTSITIGDSVTSIGGSAFYGCSGLTSITIPDSVTSIGNSAFFYCSGLTSVTIGDGVTSIGNSAFSGCSGLTSITVADGNTVYHSTNNCLIKTTSKILIAGCNTSVIPTDGSVTSIGNYAFYNCSWLTSITIPDSVKSIGDSAFSGCTGLTEITIPDSVKSIGDYAFSRCSGLKSVTIPDSVTSIGYDAFYNCSGLTSVKFKNTSGWYVTKTQGASSGTIVTVTNASTNATNLKTTYYNYYWYRK